MPVPQFAQNVYSYLWQFIMDAAGSISPATGRSYSSSDVVSAAADIARAEGQQLAFADFTGVAQLYGVARSMETAADALTGAAEHLPITDAHVSEPPWARPLTVQTAAPMWQLRAEITYRAPDGSVITTWGTGVFHNVLPTTVGALRDEAWLQFTRMLSKRSEQRNTGGELLSIGRQYLFSV
jgi:hypothetical protein